MLRRDGRLIAALPMRRHRTDGYEQLGALANFYTTRFVPLLGDEVSCSDLTFLLRAIRRERPRAAGLDLAPLDKGGAAFERLRGAMRAAGYVTFEYFRYGNWFLPVTQSSNDYLAARPGEVRSTLRRMGKRFAAAGGRVEVFGEPLVPSRHDSVRRRIGYVFQDVGLFPHMTVAENVAVAPRLEAWPESRIEARTRELLALVGLPYELFGDRYPHQLSGGQRQRVALARALIRRPKVLLLDEPLSALDKKLREQTQFELMNIQYRVGTTFIFVTHDQDEAMALATRIAVMDRGRVVQVGAPAEIYEFPKNRMVADFIGTTNIFEGHVDDASGGRIRVSSAEAGGNLLVEDPGPVHGGQQVWVSLRPEKIRISKAQPPEAGVNCIKGVVWELGYLGNRSTYRIKTSTGKLVTVFAQNDQRTSEWSIDWSDEVYISWAANAAVVLQS